MKKIWVFVGCVFLICCSSESNRHHTTKSKAETNIKSTSTEARGKPISPSATTAVITSIRAKNILDHDTVVSIIEAIANENGEKIYSTPFLGPDKDISLSPGKYLVKVGCYANNGRRFNYHVIKADVDADKIYTIYCLKKAQKVLSTLLFDDAEALFAFISENSVLAADQAKYQAQIDSMKKGK